MLSNSIELEVRCSAHGSKSKTWSAPDVEQKSTAYCVMKSVSIVVINLKILPGSATFPRETK